MEWIDVNDRLPEKDEEVFFIDRNDLDKAGSFHKGYYGGGKTWTCDCCRYYDGCREDWYDVKYWMPFVEPIKNLN